MQPTPSKRPKLDPNSPYKRPYPSRRKRDAAKRSAKSPVNKLLLRMLAVLVVLLVATLVVIFKDVGKSQMASGTLVSGE